MWMKLLSKISKDHHIIKKNWFGSKAKRTKNQQNSLWLSSQTNDGTNFHARTHKHHGCLHVTQVYNNITKEREWKTYITTKAQCVLI